MTSDKPFTTNPRGILVIDQSYMIDLVVPVPESDLANPSLNSNTTRLLDLLPLLAKFGYQIFIPEIAAYKGAHVLRDGVNLNKLFQFSDKNPVRHEQKRVLSRYLMNMLNDGLATIAPPSDHTSSTAVFLNDLHSVLTSNSFYERDKRTRVIDIQSAIKNVDSFGEESVFELINSLGQPSCPIFFCHPIKMPARMPVRPTPCQ